MALSVSTTSFGVPGAEKFSTGTITFDSSYPTNGESLTAANLGFPTAVRFIAIEPTDGYVFEYNYADSKVIAYRSAAVASTPAAAAALAEVGNTVDLSASVARYFAIGV